MIEHAFEVRTDLFEVTTPGPHFINDRCFGEDFAAWLAARLAAMNIASETPVQEDWGWALIVRYGGRRFTIAIGVMDESIGETPAEWRIGVCYEKTMNGVRAWFQSPPHDRLAELASVIETVLRAEPRITNVASAE